MKTVSLVFCLPPFCSNPNLSFGSFFGGRVKSMQLLKDWKSVPEKEKTSFFVNVTADSSSEA